MKFNRIFTFLFSLIFLLCVFAGNVKAGPEELVQIKNNTYTNLEGKVVKLSKYKGKVLFLNFWASWCGPCIMEIPSLNRFYSRYHPRGLEVLSLSLDTEYSLTRIKDIAQRTRMRYKIGKANQEMINEMKIFAIPTSYLYGKDGKLIQRYMGPPNPAQITKDIEAALAK